MMTQLPIIAHYNTTSISTTPLRNTSNINIFPMLVIPVLSLDIWLLQKGISTHNRNSYT